ncbi:hypothetical protein PGTUg99_025005 [Puccinia graminis f. sp. tritici]|uniref:Uncharacterized protein n=1 Tax=Puccinia graminis f. sp. tritici TaxID=56615 RepID=A0A5B0S1Y7_PUCGR|nr:hypothetical protein PGTUg99_025005 [Puccinia graminis f. sp. tritici]
MGQPNIILTHPTQVRDEQTNDVGRLSPPEMIVSLTSSQATVPHTQSANEGLFEGASQRCRLVKPLSNPTAGFDASLLSKDQPTAGLYAKPMLEDMPTMASNTSRYETLGRPPKFFGGVGRVRLTLSPTSASSRPAPVVYNRYNTRDMDER